MVSWRRWVFWKSCVLNSTSQLFFCCCTFSAPFASKWSKRRTWRSVDTVSGECLWGWRQFVWETSCLKSQQSNMWIICVVSELHFMYQWCLQVSALELTPKQTFKKCQTCLCLATLHMFNPCAVWLSCFLPPVVSGVSARVWRTATDVPSVTISWITLISCIQTFSVCVLNVKLTCWSRDFRYTLCVI